MIQSFFPSSIKWVQQNSPAGTYLIDGILFPSYIASRCPEAEIAVPIILSSTSLFGREENSSTTLRLPFLFIGAIVGIGIGIRCGYLQWIHRRRRHNNQNNNNNNVYLSFAFWTFGFMNWSAVFVHCLWESPSISNYPQKYPLFWMIDTYMTGVSSICLLFASFQHYLVTQPQPPPPIQHHLAHDKVYVCWMICQLIGTLCIGWFLYGEKVHKQRSLLSSMAISPSHPLELWYLFPPVLAGLPITHVMFWDTIVAAIEKNRNKSFSFLQIFQSLFQSFNVGQCLFVFGAMIALLGILLDRFWCIVLHDYLWLVQDLFTASTLIFWGCDFMFLGIHLSFPTTTTPVHSAVNQKEKGDKAA